MRERSLDIRDCLDEEDALLTLGTDLRLPDAFSYSWESLQECLQNWAHPMKVRVMADPHSKVYLQKFQSILEGFEQHSIVSVVWEED